MLIRSDKEAIAYRDNLLCNYSANHSLIDIKFRIRTEAVLKGRVIGSRFFYQAIINQLQEIVQLSSHGQILLSELASLPIEIDFIEYPQSRAAFYNDSVVILHNATSPQGGGRGRFEDAKGRALRGSFLPAMALAHELFHAGQLQQTKFFEPYCNWLCSWTGGPWKLPTSALERGAIRYTNQIRLDKNFGYVRTYHTIAKKGGIKMDSYKEALKRQNQ